MAPFDPDRLVLTGSPQPLVDVIRRDGAGNDGPTAQLAVSRTGTLAFVPDVNALRRMVLVGRAGEAEPLSLPPARYDRVAASPDGQSIAFQVGGLSGTLGEVRVYDLARGTTTSLTQQGSDRSPSWRPDGGALSVSTTGEVDQPGLYLKELGGISRLLVPREAGGPVLRNTSWSPDGQELAYTAQSGSAHDIWVLNVDDNLDAVPLLSGPAAEYGPRFSPDGRWLAYSSDESGRIEVYVKPYPQGAGIPVSAQGGNGAVWRRDGGELFFQGGVEGEPTMMAVSVEQRGDTLQLGDAVPLFSLRTLDSEGTPRVYAGTSNGGRRWDVLPDGRFVMLQGPGTSVNREIVVVQNWLSELQRLVLTN